MRKFGLTVYGFAEKGTKILGHWGSKVNRHTEVLAEESLLGAKLLRHYGSRSNCHAELVSASYRGEIPKRVQGDNVFVHGDNPYVIARSETTKQSQQRMALKRLLRYARNDGKVLRRCAFTLSEVLIVLAVLGVIAAMTIPDLIQDYREKALITALKKSYTVFSQAVDMAVAENGPITGWDIGIGGNAQSSLKLYNILKPYLKIVETCGTGSGCFAEHYEALFSENWVWQPATSVYFAKGVLVSGTSFFTFSAGTGCPDGNDFCGYIGVDVNGKSGPNKAGVDLFYLNLLTDGVKPAGYGYSYDKRCIYKDTYKHNGAACAWWAITHENMDYLRKPGTYTK